MGLENPSYRQRRPGRLHRHLIIGRQALCERLELFGRGLDPASEPQLGPVLDRDLAEIAVHI